jgi:hypothetical protein
MTEFAKNPPLPSIPTIPVTFIYVDAGKIEREFQAICTSIPREGELVFPPAGSTKVIVHVVTYGIKQIPGVGSTIVPFVFLRELTTLEEARVGRISER